MTMEVSEEFFGAAVKYAIDATRSPNIEEILAAKHIIGEPGHNNKVPYSKPRILSEDEVRKMYGMEE